MKLLTWLGRIGSLAGTDTSEEPTTPLTPSGPIRRKRIEVYWKDGRVGKFDDVVHYGSNPQIIRGCLTFEHSDPEKGFVHERIPLDAVDRISESSYFYNWDEERAALGDAAVEECRQEDDNETD